MPYAYPIVLLLFGHRRQHAEFHHDLVEDHPVEFVEVRPGHLAFADLVHRGSVAGAPAVGKVAPVEFESFRFGECAAFLDDGTAPIHNRSESIEDECLWHDGGSGCESWKSR